MPSENRNPHTLFVSSLKNWPSRLRCAAARCPSGSSEVWSKGVSVPARPAGAARPVLHSHHVAKRATTRSSLSERSEQAELARQHVESGHEFRKHWWKGIGRPASGGATLRLEASQAASQEAAKKTGFKTAFGIRNRQCRARKRSIGTVVVDEWDLEAICETAARRMAMRVAARVVEQRLNADTSDHAGPMLPCACGQSARYAGRHGKNFESVLGPCEAGARLLPLRAVRSGFLSA